jgi:hypothetical protein
LQLLHRAPIYVLVKAAFPAHVLKSLAWRKDTLCLIKGDDLLQRKFCCVTAEPMLI